MPGLLGAEVRQNARLNKGNPLARVQIFLSTVSAEFRSYRDALRHDLDRPNVTVKVQEDFIATGTETLGMLDGYIKQCDAVIHLVGDMTGAPAQPPSVTAIRQAYPDFNKRLPFLSPFLQSDGPALPYTQWEAWLALYHGKRLIIWAPEKGAPRDERYRVDPEQIAAQRAHLERLASVERYPRYFANADRLAVEVLRSQLLDILASAEAAQSAGPGLIDFAQERMRHGEIIGREFAIGTVRGWINDASKGWVLIKGGPGTGKSAILAAILNRLENEYGPESVPHHFLRRGQGNWNEPDAVVGNLVARLERISTSTERSTAQGMERLFTLLVAVAGQYATNNRRLVLIVDGLDEAAVASDAERVLSRFLPAAPPDNVFIVCASRPNYPELGWLDQRPGLRTIDLDQPPWLADNRSLVDAYWRKRGPLLKPPLEAELLEKAIDAAEGNMLHAVTLFDAFEANTRARDPQRIPVGFNALLEDLWLRLVDMRDRETSTRVIDGLGLLAVAGEALPLATLARLLNWKHPADIADFKRYALPFLLEESADWHGGEARYRPFHESTREFLTSADHMLPDMYRGYHELLARRLAAWPPADGAGQLERGYASRFALVHLSAIADWSHVSALLGDLHYCVAAVEALRPQLLLARMAAFSAAGKPPQLIERANVLQRVLRQESQWLETYPRELPNLIHNRLTCLGWSRERIRSSFSGFDRGWGLVNAVAMGDEICILRGHTASVSACDIESSGRYGVSGGWDGNLRVWDLERGTPMHVLRPDPSAGDREIESCAISPDGRHLLVSSGPGVLSERSAFRRIQLWDARDGRLIHEFDNGGPDPAEVAFAGNEQAILCHGSGRIDLYDIAQGTGRQLTLNEGSDKIAVDASGTLIATVTYRGCCVWRLTDGGKVSEVPFEAGEFCSFSPDGKAIAVAARGRAVIANSADGFILYRTSKIGKQISDCVLLDNRRLLFTSDWDVEVVVWDVALDCATVRYEGHTYTANCCAATPDGRLALSGGGDNTVRLWSLGDKTSAPKVDRHAKLDYGCTLDASATLACSAPQDDHPVIWDARSGTQLRPVKTPVQYGYVRFCQFDDHLRLATLGKSLRLFDPKTAQLVWEAPIPVRDNYDEVSWVDENTFEGGLHGADRGHHNLLPLIYASSHVIVWQPTGELQQVKLPGKESAVSRLNAGRAIAALSGNTLRIIDLDNSKARRKIAEGVKACVGSPRSNSVYVLMENGQLCRLDAASGKVQVVLGEVRQDNVRLLIDPQETALWALCGRRDKWAGSTIEHALIAFSPERAGVLEHASIPGHDVFGICFLDGMLITAGWDATLRVWDAHQPMPLAAISGSAPFRCVDAARDRLIAGDQKGNVWFLAPMDQLYA
jgi:WD40 repeat protein